MDVCGRNETGQLFRLLILHPYPSPPAGPPNTCSPTTHLTWGHPSNFLFKILQQHSNSMRGKNGWCHLTGQKVTFSFLGHHLDPWRSQAEWVLAPPLQLSQEPPEATGKAVPALLSLSLQQSRRRF